MNNLVTLVVGLIFGFGLALAGMTHPQKVLAFLDVAGQWDASLLFVLGGAVGVTVISFRFILKLPNPLFARDFLLSELHHVDRPLILGAVLFGIGWGVSGYCPGPAIASFAAPNWESWVFFPALVGGYVLQRVWETRRSPSDASEKVTEVRNGEPPVCG